MVNIHIPRAVVEEDLTAAPESAEVPAINVKDDTEQEASESKEKAEKGKD